MAQPFLTIITRCYNRPEQLKKNVSSVLGQKGAYIQHLKIEDNVGRGLFWANSQPWRNRHQVYGDYVYILDDDNYLTDKEFAKKLKVIAEEHQPDAIIVKGQISGKLYPTVWEQTPERRTIDSANIVVKNEVFQRHIEHFCQDRAGDFFYINSIFNKKYKIHWMDEEVFCATVSRCAPEGLPIDTRIPYIPGGHLGNAYNVAMATVKDWVLFLDHDILNVNPHYFEACVSAIERVGHRAGWITCKTNRIANPMQHDSTAPQGDDIMAHMAHAGSLWKKHKDKLELVPPATATNYPFSGFFILTHKKAWEEVNGFIDGFLGVDNDYHHKLIKAGYQSYIMPGVYCYHIYKNKQQWAGG